MQQVVVYRGYKIHHDGTENVAEPVDGNDETFEIAASDLNLLFGAIDELWRSLDASRPDEDSPLPDWYQRWLDDGACGRIRITAHGKHESVTARRWSPRRLAIAAALAALSITAVAPHLDINGDGAIDLEDYSHAAQKAFLARPPRSFDRRIRFDNRVYDVTLRPSQDDGVFTAHDITINKVSVRQAEFER